MWLAARPADAERGALRRVSDNVAATASMPEEDAPQAPSWQDTNEVARDLHRALAGPSAPLVPRSHTADETRLPSHYRIAPSVGTASDNAQPGGFRRAHLLSQLPEGVEASPEREALLEAFELRDRMLALVKRGDRLGLGREFERLLTVEHPSGVVAAAGAPMTTWRGDLVPGQSRIRIIDDVEEFQRLCERPAPGANEDSEVGWCEDEMEELAGEEFTVEGLDEDDRAYKIKVHYRVPFDACILVRV